MTDVKGEIKTSKTLSLPVSVWQLIEQIQNEKGFKNVDEAMAYSISEMAKKLDNQISN